jgi:four helix bundle protein
LRNADLGLRIGEGASRRLEIFLSAMNAEEFKNRTKAFAVRVINLVESLSATPASNVVGKQSLRSGTSVGANYRAACRARSRAEFIAKMGIVEEECDESIYWMELLIDARQMKPRRLTNLMKEADELLSMVVVSSRTAKTCANPQSAIRNPK